MSAPTPLRVALVGCGDISALHLDAIASAPDSVLVAACDVISDRADAVARAHGALPFDDWEVMLDEVRPDVLHVCTPHHLHAPIAVRALQLGTNVLTEKPLAHSVDAGAALVAAAAESTAQLGVCFQNRYNGPVQMLRSKLAAGDLGVPQHAAATVLWHRTAEYYAASPWRGRWDTAGGGLLMNQAIHTLDLAQWLLGDVVGVQGHAATRHLGGAIEVEDTAEMLLTHESGATTAFYATLAHGRNAPVDIEIVTDEAVVRLRDDLTVTWHDGTTELLAEAPPVVGERGYWGVSHSALIADFYRCVHEGVPFWIDGAEADKTLRVIQSVYDQTYPDRQPQR
ncbi:Gfo/Idh/MocA family oxidoreductase [Curtobacterium pusillum]|uniref:Gfo/Idh/MocA family oxidoreductase n=1 Tax=Curtobacterium pusillum TaxID=69373 RepID=A0ABX2M6X6_9MICO|nr:Gfo/Idh/MocA family oxidoreductase [Curtobacterium pusillum]NUU12518.1 Gfo/Idh/MocA family oxidoreductase [Curtobacterium pusillum]GLK33029.1 dehydrogenase [Curtobacterium pusillum]